MRPATSHWGCQIRHVSVNYMHTSAVLLEYDTASHELFACKAKLLCIIHNTHDQSKVFGTLLHWCWCYSAQNLLTSIDILAFFGGSVVHITEPIMSDVKTLPYLAEPLNILPRELSNKI